MKTGWRRGGRAGSLRSTAPFPSCHLVEVSSGLEINEGLTQQMQRKSEAARREGRAARHPAHPAGCTGHPSTEISVGEELCPQGCGQGGWWGARAGVTGRAQLRKEEEKERPCAAQLEKEPLIARTERAGGAGRPELPRGRAGEGDRDGACGHVQRAAGTGGPHSGGRRGGGEGDRQRHRGTENPSGDPAIAQGGQGAVGESGTPAQGTLGGKEQPQGHQGTATGRTQYHAEHRVTCSTSKKRSSGLLGRGNQAVKPLVERWLRRGGRSGWQESGDLRMAAGQTASSLAAGSSAGASPEPELNDGREEL